MLQLALEKVEKAQTENTTDTSGDNPSGSTIEPRENGLCDDGSNSYEDTLKSWTWMKPILRITSQVQSAKPATVPVPDNNIQPATVTMFQSITSDIVII